MVQPRCRTPGGAGINAWGSLGIMGPVTKRRGSRSDLGSVGRCSGDYCKVARRVRRRGKARINMTLLKMLNGLIKPDGEAMRSSHKNA